MSRLLCSIVAIGALFGHNTAAGYKAMFLGLGDRNTAIGAFAFGGGTWSSSSFDNVTLGYRAGFNINSGDHNIHIANEG